MYLIKPKILVVIIVILFSVTTAYAQPLTYSLTELKSYKDVPELKLLDLDEESFDIKSLKDRVVVVNFWATWCPPCRQEMPSLEKLRLLTEDKNITIIAVSVGEEIDPVFSFINSIDPSPEFPILFDNDASTMDKWGVLGLPTTYVINKDFKIAYKAVGGREFDHPDIVNKIINLSK